MMKLYWSPRSRSFTALWLMEETGQPYERVLTDITTGAQRAPEYLAINPMGKVPAVKHGDALVTEQVAIFIYLADLFPQAGLAPQLGDPLRGPYLRWLAFYGSCFEPALVDKAMKREPALPQMSPYGDWDTMFETLLAQLRKGPNLLGERFTAADVLWGTALTWTTSFGVVPTVPEILDYIGRWNARPSVARVKAKDAELAAAHEKAVTMGA
jgi:glutathione S-transferase